MTKKAYYIGMNVHKSSVQMAVFEEARDDPIYERRMDNDTALLVKEAVRFSREGKTEVAYEAGCLGYVIQWAMEDETDEATRDLQRCREDVSEDLRRMKQRLLKFMARHGHIYGNETGHWTLKHWQWMDRTELC